MNDLKGLALLMMVLTIVVAFRAENVLAAQPQPRFSLGLGLEYATGDYGTDETTDTYTLPLTLDYYPSQKLDFELIVPIVHQNNTNVVVSSGAQGHGMGGRMSGQQTTSQNSESQTGLGDVNLTVGYNLVAEDSRTPQVRPLAYIKLPTGDADKALGTGALELGPGVGLTKNFGGGWITYAELFYIVSGDSDQFDTQNYWNYTLSLAYDLTDKFRPGIALKGGTAAFEDTDDTRTLEFNLKYWPARRIRVEAYFSLGLTDASSDYGTGASVFIDF